MPSDECRQIDELITLYRLEPELRDVFVEGTTDEAFLQWFFHATGIKGVGVKQIETVNIPSETVNRLQLESNCRGRVIALAHVAHTELGKDSLPVTCVVDSDFDRVLQREYPYALLVLTDYSCLEAYLFVSTSIAKFLQLVVRRFPKPAETVLAEISGPLVDLFAIRLANHQLGWGLKIIDFDSCCELRDGGVYFDLQEYVSRLLNANSRRGQVSAFMQQVGDSRRMLTKEHRHYIHGHDFIKLLSWYLRQHRSCQRVSKEVVERAIYACAELPTLSGEAMFRSLLSRVSA